MSLSLPTRPLLSCHATITAEMKSDVLGGLVAFNFSQTQLTGASELAVMAHDAETGAFLGGGLGAHSFGVAYLDLLFVTPEQRKTGLGAEILAEFEAEAIRRGCISGVLYTYTFQAPGFYPRYGWQHMGAVPCLPEGTERIYYSKSFRPAAAT